MSTLDRSTLGAAQGARPPRPARRRRRWPRRVALAVAAIVVLLVGYVGVTFVQVWAASHTDQPQKAQAIIVLGAAQYDGRPSPVLEARLSHALELYQQGLAPVIVVTGGRQPGDRFTEAGTGYRYLRDRGVPDSAIRQEVQGASTWESLAAASRFLQDEGITDVLLVSDAYHTKRLLGIADEVGFEAHVSPSDEPMSTGTQLRKLARETFAVSAGRIFGYRRIDHL